MVGVLNDFKSIRFHEAFHDNPLFTAEDVAARLRIPILKARSMISAKMREGHVKLRLGERGLYRWVGAV